MKARELEEAIRQGRMQASLLEYAQQDPRRSVQDALERKARQRLRDQQERGRVRDLYRFEQEALGMGLAAGIDEAGRGPLAGPVYAACVLLPLGAFIPDLNDSKKLSPARRASVRAGVEEQALAVGRGAASVEEIDRLGIQAASHLAMQRSYRDLGIPCPCLLVDGTADPGIRDVFVRTVPDGDALCASIAAASVVAKESRDRIMEAADRLYPCYGFAAHKGYGTAEHYQALREHGPCLLHRKTFLREGEDQSPWENR